MKNLLIMLLTSLFLFASSPAEAEDYQADYECRLYIPILADDDYYHWDEVDEAEGIWFEDNNLVISQNVDLMISDSGTAYLGSNKGRAYFWNNNVYIKMSFCYLLGTLEHLSGRWLYAMKLECDRL